jgi:hypothetical protein
MEIAKLPPTSPDRDSRPGVPRRRPRPGRRAADTAAEPTAPPAEPEPADPEPGRAGRRIDVTA